MESSEPPKLVQFPRSGKLEGDKAWTPETQGSGPALQHEAGEAAPPVDETTAARAVLLVLFTAIREGDWPAFASCFLPDSVVFLDESTILDFARNEAHLRAHFEDRTGAGVPLTQSRLRMRDFRIDLQESVAIVWGGSGTRNQRGTRAVVLLKTNDGWKVRHLHTAVLGMAIPRPEAEAETA